MSILFFVMTGCATFSGLEPVKPKYVDKTKDVMPTFQWKPANKENVKYDFIIYEISTWARSGWGGGTREGIPMAGKTVYYREGLDKPVHTVEKPLAPEEYLWSVRIRENGKVGPWSRYNYHGFSVIKKNHLFQIEIEKR
jgi:hypothetical protein